MHLYIQFCRAYTLQAKFHKYPNLYAFFIVSKNNCLCQLKYFADGFVQIMYVWHITTEFTKIKPIWRCIICWFTDIRMPVPKVELFYKVEVFIVTKCNEIILGGWIYME